MMIMMDQMGWPYDSLDSFLFPLSEVSTGVVTLFIVLLVKSWAESILLLLILTSVDPITLLQLAVLLLAESS